MKRRKNYLLGAVGWFISTVGFALAAYSNFRQGKEGIGFLFIVTAGIVLANCISDFTAYRRQKASAASEPQ